MLVEKCVENGKVLGGICDASAFLADDCVYPCYCGTGVVETKVVPQITTVIIAIK